MVKGGVGVGGDTMCATPGEGETGGVAGDEEQEG